MEGSKSTSMSIIPSNALRNEDHDGLAEKLSKFFDWVASHDDLKPASFGLDFVQTGADVVQTGAGVVQTGAAVIETTADLALATAGMAVGDSACSCLAVVSSTAELACPYLAIVSKAAEAIGDFCKDFQSNQEVAQDLPSEIERCGKIVADMASTLWRNDTVTFPTVAKDFMIHLLNAWKLCYKWSKKGWGKKLVGTKRYSEMFAQAKKTIDSYLRQIIAAYSVLSEGHAETRYNQIRDELDRVADDAMSKLGSLVDVLENLVTTIEANHTDQSKTLDQLLDNDDEVRSKLDQIMDAIQSSDGAKLLVLQQNLSNMLQARFDELLLQFRPTPDSVLPVPATATNEVIDAYFAVHCPPSTLLHNLDGRPEMLGDLDTIRDYIKSKSGPRALFDRDYKIYLTDGAEVPSSLESAKVRVFFWFARGVDESGDFPGCDAVETFCTSSDQKPEVVVVCMEYGAERAAKRLCEETNIARVIWIRTNPFLSLVKLTEYAFLPFSRSYSSRKKGFITCAKMLFSNLQRETACGFVPKDSTSLEIEAKSLLPDPRSLSDKEAVTPVNLIDRRFTVSLNRDRTLKQLKVDRGDLDFLTELKLKLLPEEKREHTFIHVKSTSKQGSCRARALALCACLDLAGKFHGGIYRVACADHRDKLKLNEACNALLWIDFVDFVASKNSHFHDAESLVGWINNLGDNLTATVLVTSESSKQSEVQEIVDQLENVDECEVENVDLAESPRLHEIPVNTLIGSFAVRALDRDGKIVPLLGLPYVTSRTVVKALNDAIFSYCHAGEELFDGSLYPDDDGSVWVRFFVRDVRCLAMLRDRILLGHAERELAYALKLGEDTVIELDRTSMAEVFESMIMQLETLTPHQQDKLAESEDAILREKRSLHIQGMAGTGKTFLALNIILDYLDSSTEGNVLYVCGRRSTALKFCQWICLRLRYKDPNKKMEQLFLLAEDEPNEIFRVEFDGSERILRVKDKSWLRTKHFGLIVIDEAHDIFKVDSNASSGRLRDSILSLLDEQSPSQFERLRDFILSLFAGRSQSKSQFQLIILSDGSQSAVGDIDYPWQAADAPRVKLTEVCRCTKRIVLGARCFQLETDGEVSVAHDSDGIASIPILYPRPAETDKFNAYADKICEAVEHVFQKFPALDLHHRLAVVVADDKCREDLLEPLKAKFLAETERLGEHLHLVTAEDACSCVSARSRPYQSNGSVKRESHIVFDSVDNVAGLEFLFVLAVDLDSSLLDGAVDARLVCSRIFRAITRAQLLLYLVNEQVTNGWFDFLAFVKESKGKFEDALSMFRENAASTTVLKNRKKPDDLAVAATRPELEDKLQNRGSQRRDKLQNEDPDDNERNLNEKFASMVLAVGSQSTKSSMREPATLDVVHQEVGTCRSPAWNTSMISMKLEKSRPIHDPLIESREEFHGESSTSESSAAMIGQKRGTKQDLSRKVQEELHSEQMPETAESSVSDSITAMIGQKHESKAKQQHVVETKVDEACRRLRENDSTLTKLDLGYNNIGDDDATALAGALKSNTTLQELYLRTNNIGNDGAMALAGALKSNTTLQMLYLRDNNIGEDGATALGEALKSNNTLQSLYLFGNNIGEDGAMALAEALKCNTTLQQLNLGGNKIGNDSATALAEALKSNTTLQELYLFDNNIGEDGATALAEALKSNTTLQELNLFGNEIGNDGATALAEALKSNTTLQELNLFDNNIDKEGAAALAEALKSNTTLQSLYLEYNYIGKEGAAALAEALKSNTTLQELYLRTNNIGNDGAAALAEALKSNTTLQKLDLSSNNIGDNDAMALAEALKSNTTLQTLNLCNNNIGEDDARELLQMLLKYNGTLAYLILSGNGIDDETENEIYALAEANRDGRRNPPPQPLES